jgi:hypothetical protein
MGGFFAGTGLATLKRRGLIMAHPNPVPVQRSAHTFLELARLACDLAPAARAALHEAWSLAARFEHASIASFNKFSLELLAVGAPGELLVSANRAALQEVEHAQACFAAASAYAGQGIGPGPLPIGVLRLQAVELTELVRSTVAEGCVGEALAAAEALAARERASVPVIVSLLGKIATEEQEHAALAFRFVRWACGVGGPGVRDAARAAFESALAACRAEVPLVTASAELSAVLEAHGRLCEPARSELRRRAVTDVIEPAYRELLG